MNELTSQLIRAASSGNVKKLDNLLRQGISPNVHDDHQKSALHWAAAEGHIPIARMLLLHGANPDKTTLEGWTPLSLAERKGHTAVAHLLRNFPVTNFGKQPEVGHLLNDQSALITMMYGADDEDVEIIRALLKKGVNPNLDNGYGFTILSCASMRGNFIIVKLLLENGADPNLGSKSFVALELAASRGHTQIVEILLSHKANIWAENAEGWTALSSATLYNHIKTVKALLEHGADSLQKNVRGETPLGWADHEKHEQIVQLMLDAELINAAFCNSTTQIESLVKTGANPNAVDEKGMSGLIWAAYKDNIASVRVLLTHKANPNLKDDYGKTALISAARQEHISVVELLLKHKANAYITDDDGYTSLSYAASQNKIKVIHVLLKAGIDPNKRDDMDYTPLEQAVEGGHVKAVETLLMYNADPLSEDKDGITALDIAIDKEHHQIIKLLEDHVENRKPATFPNGSAPSSKAFRPSQLDSATLAKQATEQQNGNDLETFVDSLNKLVGLQQIKTDVAQLVNFLRVQKLRKDKGLSVPEQSLHMVFTGNPGTGKTTIARLIAQIYRSMGILSQGQFVETDRAGLVGGYLGQTAIKTKEVVESALGGVLFIDEAYSLTDSTHGHDQYGQEAVATLLKLMEDHRDDLIVIVAGYTDPMQKFIRSNPGLQSRFNKFLHFDDYAPAELTEIFSHFAAQADYSLHPATKLKLNNVFADLYTARNETFGNARLARNMFEKAINAHANRMVSAGAIDEVSLVTLYPEDVPNG